MAYFLIHTCQSRMWYVKDFLLPSMVEQGIDPEHIFVYQDRNRIGNLRAFIDSSNRLVRMCLKNGIQSVWHLQDDVCICKDFGERIRILEEGEPASTIICGFTCAYDKMPEAGRFKVHEDKLWFSFPCIRIPTTILEEFVSWANLNLWQSDYFGCWVRRNKGDDLIFKEWLFDRYGYADVLNLAPNLVNHIDDLIGGTVCNKQRDKEQNTRSIFWIDDSIIEDLEKRLNEYKLSGT